jgi:hypothetical protein
MNREFCSMCAQFIEKYFSTFFARSSETRWLKKAHTKIILLFQLTFFSGSTNSLWQLILINHQAAAQNELCLSLHTHMNTREVQPTKYFQ